MTRNITNHWNHLQRRLAGLTGHLYEPEAGAWWPNIDIRCSQDGDALVVYAELAGVRREQVQARVEANALIIEGCRQPPPCPAEQADMHYHQMEIDYGHFRRVIPLPGEVDAQNIRATMENGLLIIFLPRLQQARTIPVEKES